MPLASRFRMTILFLRMFTVVGVLGLVLVLLGIGSFGSLPVALALGIILIAIALVHLPLALLVGGAADATRAIHRSLEERRTIRSQRRDRRAGMLSMSPCDGGRLSEPK